MPDAGIEQTLWQIDLAQGMLVEKDVAERALHASPVDCQADLRAHTGGDA